MDKRHKWIALVALTSLFLSIYGILMYFEDKNEYAMRVEILKHRQHAQELIAKTMKESFDAARMSGKPTKD